MKRFQFIILMLTFLCVGFVTSTNESYAHDPPGVSVDIAINDVIVAEVFTIQNIPGVVAVYSCDLTLWPGSDETIVRSNSSNAILNKITRIGVLNKGSTSEFLNESLFDTVNDQCMNRVEKDRVPMKASGGKQVLPYS